MIKIIGLGSGEIEDLTLGSYKALKESKSVLFESINNPIFESLKNEIDVIKSYDKFFTNNESTQISYKKIVKDILEIYKETEDVVYVISKNPSNQEGIVEELIKNCNNNNIRYKIYPSVDRVKEKDKGYEINFRKLINLVETLRGENGCPWDREQTHQSIKNEFLEEVYEVVEAIDKNDLNGMKEELGDVLFHIIFHCSISEDEGNFNINDVLEGIINKMIYRHPHVFAKDSVKDSNDVLEKWDDIKRAEKKYESVMDEMNAVATTLPSLIKAHKIQKKAAKVGFDWDNVEDAAEKVKEELTEVLDVYKSNNKEKIKDEVGDLLFACVNVARKLNINGEEAVNSTIKKFINRFSFIEKSLIEMGKNFNEVSLQDMDELWVKAKKLETKKDLQNN